MKKILVVDDDQNQRELYAEELIEAGYEIQLAANGKEALGFMLNDAFDLVVMDIRMAEMDGVEALEKIIIMKKKTPVIIYTAYSHYRYNYITWTADAYLTKSSNLEELKDKIKEILTA